MSLTRLIINSDLTAIGFKSVCDLAPGQLVALNNFLDYLGGVAGGNYMALMNFEVGAVQASGTVTFASTGPTNNQTCTVCGVTFTAKTSGATGNEFNINATASTVATNFTAAINGSTDLEGIVTAEADGAVVTLTATVPGLIGNGLVMANVNLSNTTIVSFADGDEGTQYELDLN